MKVLYVASNPTGEGTLALKREITELQLKAAASSGEPVEFRFLPQIQLERFAIELDAFKPDVLHISAHGEEDALVFSDENSDRARLTADRLLAFTKLAPPRLLVLSACKSLALAERLSNSLPMVIGTTEEITNDAARSSAVLLYHCMMSGRDVKTSFEASNALLECLNEGVKTKLCCRSGIEPERERLQLVPVLVAKFSKKKIRPNKYGDYMFDLGVVGCPRDTWHVVYFTDDDEMAGALDRNDFEREMCSVSRTASVFTRELAEVWEDATWPAYGDHRLYACGVTASGQTFTVASTLCTAVEAYCALRDRNSSADSMAPDWRKALRKLREKGGSKFN